MKYNKVYVSTCPDVGENKGGYYCQVYSDEDMTIQIDDFCIHPDDCDCSDDNAIERFIIEYTKIYDDESIWNTV